MRPSLHILMLFVLGIGLRLNAQNSIKLYDAESLELLAFANIKLTELSSNTVVQTISNDLGLVEIPFNGETLVEISYIGYESFQKVINPSRTNIIYLFPLEKKVDEVVITGNPTETGSKESMYEVKVIGKEELSKRMAVSLSDALMTEMNVQITNDGVLGSQVNLQGLGGNNVKIMIDGVPVIGRLDGNIDLSQVNLNNIERIEVVEGPLSAIYGSNAIAGVINLITKQNQKNKVEGMVNTYYESIGTYNIDGYLGFKKNNHFVQFNAGRYFFDGWNPTAFDRDVQWNPKEQYFGEASYLLRTKKDWFVRWKGSYFQDKILNRYDPSGIIPKAFDDWYQTKRVDFVNTVSGQINKNLSLNSTNSYNVYQRIKSRYQKDLTSLESTLVLDTNGEDNQDTTIANQWMTRTFISYKNPSKIISFQTGIDFNIENGKGGRFADENGNAAIIADLAGFFSANISVNEKLKIQPALRYGYNSQFKTLPTPSLLLKFEINPHLSYRLNYGMGFRAPSLKEMFLVFNDANHSIFGNRDLSPEQSQNLSSSLLYSNKKKLHEYSLNTKLFFNHKYNAIALTPDDNNVYQYINISQFNSMGAQVDAKYQFKNFQANFGISYTGISSNVQSANLSHKYFFYPQLQSSLSYNFIKAKLSVTLINKWNGPRKDYRLNSDNTPDLISIQAYDLMNLNVQKSFWKDRIQLSAGIKNILNVSNIIGTSSTSAHSGDNNQSQIAAGRSYFVGLKFGTGK